MKVFAIYDRAIETFTPPFFQPTANGALRQLKNEMKNPDSQLAAHPTDFELWELGDYNEQTGDLIPAKTKIARMEDVKE